VSAAQVVNLLVAALLLAGVYAIMSYGLALAYGVMKLVNLAHAGFMMLGAYLTLEAFRRLGLDPLLGAVATAGVLWLVGMGVYWLLVRHVPTGDEPTLPSLLLLFGVWLVLQNIGYLIWGTQDQAILTPRTLQTLRLGPVTLPVVRVLVFLVALVGLVVLHLVLGRTWFGRAVRALTQNRQASRIVGIDVGRTAMLAFGASTAFSGLAGGLLATLYSFNPDFGGPFLLRSFVIIVLGGLESFAGVALGGLVLALLETFSVLVIPAGYQLALSFGLLVVALLVLPGGLPSLFAWRRRL
jgi:branched-chain amino acid transport system permease protein